MSGNVSRRRAVAILASVAGLPLIPFASRPAVASETRLYQWQGFALGARSSISLYHSDEAEAKALLADCVGEIQRLEAVLSLYRPGSALCRLNAAGRLDLPPLDLVQVLAEAQRYSVASNGAFDVTVQPLWDLYAGHFARAGADPNGPSDAAIAAAIRTIDYRKVRFDTDRIEMPPGMRITLDGIARGYATDKVAALLRARGMRNVLVQLDKAVALGPHADGRPWRVGLANPRAPDQSLKDIALVDKAVGSSGGYGTVFDPAGRFNHLFIPSTGRSAHYAAQVTVVTRTGLAADALSTALSVVPRDQAAAVMRAVGGGTAYFVDDGNVITELEA